MTKRRQLQSEDVLLTFSGFHDPFSPSLVQGVEQEGPILSLVHEGPFSHVVLIATPRTTTQTAATEAAIKERFPGVAVQTRHANLEDPTDYFAILRVLRAEFSLIAEHHPGARYFVATASGTPHMHACWLLLVASGEIPARLLHVRPPQFVTSLKPVVSEIDLSNPEFPRVRPNVWADVETDEVEGDPREVIRRVGLVGNHPSFSRALERAILLAPSDIPVLILGETGTGKELVAELIHHLSRRARGTAATTASCTSPARGLAWTCRLPRTWKPARLT